MERGKKDLSRLPTTDVRRILDRIEQLKENPRAEVCITLSGEERHRVRVGVYRILYEILDTELIITVVKVAHRREAYR